MKITITQAEVDALIRGAFNLQPDAAIEIVGNKEVNASPQELKPDTDGWIINTKITSGPPSHLRPDDKIVVIYNDGAIDTGMVCDWRSSWWDTSGEGYIAKYRKAN